MLKHFRNSASRHFYEGKRVRAFSEINRKQAAKRFAYLEAANLLDDLRMPPSNHFEALTGDRNGEYSIRINLRWRICFRWVDDELQDIEISKNYE